MNLLIVDDQPSIVASLLTGIHWRELGFSNVFSATSVLAAREIFKKEKVDILLTDIEMPVENGISLLSWVRESGLDTECIFLTSHPDFFYAKQAIALDVVDYVLQPAKNEDIIRAAENAKMRYIKKHNPMELKINKFTSAAQNTVLRDFFENWPDAAPENKSLLEKKLLGLKEMGFSLDGEDPVFLAWTEIVRWSKIPPAAAAFIVAYQRTLDEVMGFINKSSVSYYMDDGHLCSVIFGALDDTAVEHMGIFQENLSRELGMHTHMRLCALPVGELRRGMEFLQKNGLGGTFLARENHLAVLELPPRADAFSRPSGPVKYRKYYAQILDCIRQNMDQPLTRQNIADKLFLSPDYINNIVKQCVECSCTELIIRVKMDHAHKLLETTDLPVGEVAKAVGYTSFAYFSKVYKDMYKQTPSAARRR